MKCSDIEQLFRDKGTWVDWQTTTDACKAGDASKPVQRVAVSWKASFPALREAVARGADLFVSHESIGVQAKNGPTDPESTTALPTEQPKFEWLRQTGLVVYRCHDFWDRYPGEGVRDSWLRGLALNGRSIADRYPYHVTEIAPVTVRELARHVLDRIRPLRQDGILVAAGDLDRHVSRIGTGTGAATDPLRMRELGAEAGVIADDFFAHVRMGVHARELDFPLLVVNHGVAEEWGIANLAGYLQRAFPALEVFHIPQFCPYTVVT